MIRRTVGDDFFLITQQDHAHFAGQMAAHWSGLAEIASDSDKQAVLDAVRRHDDGWAAFDQQPALNAAGLPRDVLETPIEIAVRIWSSSTEQGLAGSPLTALLISLHQLRLSDLVQGRALSSAEIFALNKFQHWQVEIQERLRRQLGYRTDVPLHFGLAAAESDIQEDQLSELSHLLWCCDALSLQLCRGELLPRTGLIQKAQFLNDSTLAVDSWPFAIERISAMVPARRLSGKSFASELAFQAAYQAAKPDALQLNLRADVIVGCLTTKKHGPPDR